MGVIPKSPDQKLTRFENGKTLSLQLLNSFNESEDILILLAKII